MKKLFTYFIALSFALCMFAAPSMACSGWGCQEANGSYQGQAYSSDHDYSGSYRGNDTASARASGAAFGSVDTHASGHGFAQEFGFVSVNDKSCTWSWTRDYGYTSKAGAGAVTEGSAFVGGEAFGLCCGREKVNTEAEIGGSVEQWNHAEESGYSGGDFVVGGSHSGATFTATNYGGDSGRTFAADLEGISGRAITKGDTYVTIDPNGSHQSLYGKTEAMSRIEVCRPDSYQGSVYGVGGVRGGVSSGKTFGQASSSFNYTGSHSGNGAATINVDLYNGGNSSSVNVSGSSYATGR